MSFDDYRLAQINEYNSAVASWNNAEGTSGKFQVGKGLNATLAALHDGTTTHVLLGSVAPEPLGDKSLRSQESFTDVDAPYYFNRVKRYEPKNQNK